MSFLLDTNIVSSYLKRPAGLNHRFIQYSGRLTISTISLAELYVWAYQREKPEQALAAINDLLHQHLEVRPFDQTSAVRFGLIRNELKPLGIVVPQVDLLLAATAIAHNDTLVTHNTKDFDRIPGLRIEDWLSP